MRLLTSRTLRPRALFVAAFAVALAAPAAASAQDESSPGVIYKKKTVLSFDDDTIDGDLTRPDHGYIESRKRGRHSNLIKIRDNFRDKILGSHVKL